MILKKTMALMLLLPTFGSAYASGFALYEPSAYSHAMGGALVGKAFDASANYNNPATLTDLTNIQVTVGFVTEHPRCQVRGATNGKSWGKDECLDPGLFWLPHLQLAIPLPAGFAFGLGVSAEYGLGSKYSEKWPMAWNSTETTVQGFVINPNLAYSITEDWSVGVGLRWLYFDFDQSKNLLSNTAYLPIKYRLHGNNRFESLGWQAGTKYDILDNLAVGIVYKSPIDVNVRGDTEASTSSANPEAIRQKAASLRGGADAELTLPQSVTAGLNWDVFDSWHLGYAVSWTQWSVFDELMFNVNPTRNPVYLGWKDTWRMSIGSAWDFADDWTWMISYLFDMDCTEPDQSSTMLPPAHRNIVSTGFNWNVWRGLDLCLSYSCIFMDGNGMTTTDSVTGAKYHMETCRGFCHAVGFSVTYRF